MNLKNKTILITGASGGIGEAAALAVARRGARPVICARRENKLQAVAQRIESETGVQAPICAADLTRPEDRARLCSFLNDHIGELHVLVNNAGLTAHGRFDESVPEVLRRTMELNFFVVAELTRELLPLMKRTAGPRLILLVSTPSGLYGVPGRFAYSASKAAGHALMESLRIELREDGINTAVYCPGYTRTNLRVSGIGADGRAISEAQAPDAMTAEEAGEYLRRAIESEKRFTFTGFNGHALYWLRSLAPGFLENKMAEKLRNDYKKTTDPDSESR